MGEICIDDLVTRGMMPWLVVRWSMMLSWMREMMLRCLMLWLIVTSRMLRTPMMTPVRMR